VKGENGCETVEFFAGGIGWNTDTDEKEEPYPDSFQKTSICRNE